MYDFKVHSKIENIIADQLPEKSIENNLFILTFYCQCIFIFHYIRAYMAAMQKLIFFSANYWQESSWHSGTKPPLKKEERAKLQKGNWFPGNGLGTSSNRSCLGHLSLLI